MTRDVCTCCHLEQTHYDVETDELGGACRMSGCECQAFESEDDALEAAA